MQRNVADLVAVFITFPNHYSELFVVVTCVSFILLCDLKYAYNCTTFYIHTIFQHKYEKGNTLISPVVLVNVLPTSTVYNAHF